MGKRLAAVQSSSIPWKGYFDLINAVDEFVLLDDVQYALRDWRNRNRIKSKDGVTWLTIPVQSKGNCQAPIRAITIGEPGWNVRHWRTIAASHGRARCSFLTDAPVGDNCFILEDDTIQPFVEIGSDVTLWSGNHMGHESVIEDHRVVSARVVVAGRVRIRPCCFIGVNATLRHGITIAPRTLGGAGTVVTEDTVEDGVHLPPRAVLSDRKRSEFDL